MLFNSLHFAFYFTVVLLLYFLFPVKLRNKFLLAASCYFYMAFIPQYILILIWLITLDYWAGRWIEKTSEPAMRKSLLLLSLASNLGVLFFFKYFNFFIANVEAVFASLGWSFEFSRFSMVLPIGLSFHTLQSMAYIVEIYRGRQNAEKNFITYSLYILFFPQLLAGPIERPQNLIRQFSMHHKFDLSRFFDGLQLMGIGLYKKVIVADFLGTLAQPVFSQPRSFGGMDLCLAGLLFGFEIYCDFSGYSDMARGAARILGFDLMVNFNHPFYAENLYDLWKRWHISLSTWLRDYLYIPLGGKLQLYRNLMIVFLLSGLWHGASWNFVLWGGINGLFVCVLILTQNFRQRFAIFKIRFINILFTYLGFCFTLFLFRSQNLDDALWMISHLLNWNQPSVSSTATLGLSALLIFSVEIFQYIERHPNLQQHLSRMSRIPRWSIMYSCSVFVILLAYFSLVWQNQSSQAFIYFQF